MAALATKPGINGANTLSIPQQWSPTWFRSFIANSLKGADVRNANGINGIVVSGNIASPYATIALGGTAPIILTNNITLSPTAGVALTINGVAGSHAIDVSGPALFRTITGGNTFFVTGNQTGITVEAWGPTAATLVDLTPDTGTYVGTATGLTTAPTGTIVWARVGNLVTLVIPGAMSGLSNATTYTITGAMPAEIQPARSQVLPIPASQFDISGAASTTTQVLLTGSSSTISFRVSGNAAGFPNDNLTKGVVSTFTISYLLN